MHISASQLSLFDECPRKWWAFYVKKIERRPPSEALNLGLATHKILELAFKAKLKNVEKWSDPYNLISLALKQFSLTQDNQLMLNSLISNAINAGWFSNFNQKTVLEDEMLIQFNDDVKIIGKIDRVDYLDNSVVVSDLKTGKTPYNTTELNESWQTKLYAYNFLKRKPEIDKVQVKFWFLRLGSRGILSTNVPSSEIDLIENRLRTSIDKMQVCDGKEKRQNKFCKWCDFFGECSKM